MDRLISEQAVLECLRKNWLAGTVAHRVIDELAEAIKAITSAYKGMTNGEVISTLFPDLKAVSDVGIMGDTILIGQDEPYCKCQFDRNWWNASYSGRK